MIDAVARALCGDHQCICPPGTCLHPHYREQARRAIAAYERAMAEVVVLEPLGHDFEKVLYDNLWDLYVRSA